MVKLETSAKTSTSVLSTFQTQKVNPLTRSGRFDASTKSTKSLIKVRFTSLLFGGIRDEEYTPSVKTLIRILDILGFRAKNFNKSQEEFQDKPRIGKKMEEDSRFPLRTSVIMKPSEVSENELKNYPKTSSIMEFRSKNGKFQTQI